MNWWIIAGIVCYLVAVGNSAFAGAFLAYGEPRWGGHAIATLLNVVVGTVVIVV